VSDSNKRKLAKSTIRSGSHKRKSTTGMSFAAMQKKLYLKEKKEKHFFSQFKERDSFREHISRNLGSKLKGIGKSAL
jgi:hypothetical protein